MTRIDPEQGINTLTEYVPCTAAVEGAFSEFNTVSIIQFRRWLNAVKAQAWEEGRDAFDDAHRWDNAEPWEYLAGNPYSETS